MNENVYAINRDKLKKDKPWICELCGHRIKKADLTVDHIVPQSRGGGHEYENLRLVHAKCNTIKGNYLDHELPFIKKAYFLWKNFLTIFIP